MRPSLLILPFIGSVLALSVPRAETDSTSCTCEQPVCIQSWPESCLCENEAKKECYEKCGGVEPTYQNCNPREKARAPEPVPEPEPEPEPQAATCQCEPPICPDVWPKSCQCQNDAKKKCYEKCGGVAPTYQTCPRDVSARAPQPMPEPEPMPEPQAATCTCEPPVCIQSWPDSCKCENEAKKECYEKCGGTPPVYANCR